MPGTPGAWVTDRLAAVPRGPAAVPSRSRARLPLLPPPPPPPPSSAEAAADGRGRRCGGGDGYECSGESGYGTRPSPAAPASLGRWGPVTPPVTAGYASNMRLATVTPSQHGVASARSAFAARSFWGTAWGPGRGQTAQPGSFDL